MGDRIEPGVGVSGSTSVVWGGGAGYIGSAEKAVRFDHSVMLD